MWGSIISAAATVGSALIASNANQKAASQATAAQNQSAQVQADSQAEAARIYADAQLKAQEQNAEAQREARQEYRQAADRGIGAIQAGTSAGVNELYRAPGEYERTIAPMLRHEGTLTPQQEIGREDMLRSGRNLLAASGMRGTGRGGVTALLDSDRRFVADAQATNQNRADQARSGLASVRAEAPARAGQAQIQQGRDIAATETGTGQMLGQSLSQQGRFAAQGQQQAGGFAAQGQQAAGQAAGQAASNIGTIQANQTTASGNLWGQAMGSLGAVASDALEQRRNRTRVI